MKAGTELQSALGTAWEIATTARTIRHEHIGQRRLQMSAAESSNDTRLTQNERVRTSTNETRPALENGPTNIVPRRVLDPLLVWQAPRVSPPYQLPAPDAIIDFQPHPGSDAPHKARFAEPWFFDNCGIDIVCRDIACRLQIVVDLLRCFRVGSSVPSFGEDGRILAVGGSPLVKFDYEQPHGTIRGACIVEGGTVSGADFNLRLSHVKKSTFRAQIAPDVSSP
eukprot:COSAG01_NODE_23935_length_796_cov_1.823529_1_plen_223_part_10